MSLGIHGEAMDSVLDAKVFQLAVVVWIILMKNGNGAAVTGDIDAAETSIEFDDIRPVSQRQKGDGRVLVQIEDGHQVVLFAREKCAVVLRVKRHSVIALAVPDGISTYNFVSCWIDDCEDVQVLQIDVYLAGYGIILRHSSFTVEM